MDRPFEEEDIEDVRIIVKAKGKHWGLVPAEDVERDRADKMRKLALLFCLTIHEIVDKPLEDLRDENAGRD